jgi:hypothetical protein
MNVPVYRITVIDTARRASDGDVEVTLTGPDKAFTLKLTPRIAEALVQDIKLTGVVRCD